MDNVQSQDSRLSLDNAPAGMAPMEATTDQEQTPSESSGETPQNDAVGVEQNETPTEGQSQEAEELIAGKFKSQEDLIKAYKELESHNKKVEMERSDLEKLFVEKESDSAKPDDASTTQAAVEEVRDQVSEGKLDGRQAAQIVEKLLAKPLAKLELNDMINRYGDDFKANAKAVHEKQKHNPSLSMEDAYKLVSFDNLKRTSHTQGVEAAYKNVEAKKKAQVESSRPSGYRPTSIEDAINDPNTSVSEIADAMGPEWSAFKKISEKKARLTR